ncbi:MAG: hypothetical protein U0P46_08900 [Holophagaceae bacterium]
MRIPFALLLPTFLVAQATVKSPQKEHIQFGVLPGSAPWTEVTNKRGADAAIQEFIPRGQNLEDFRDMWTFQTFNSLKGKSPAEFIKVFFTRFPGACESVRVNGPKEQVEGGLQVAYAQIYCGRQKGKDYGVNIFIKAIAGKEALYLVQREFHIPPSERGGVTSFSKDQMTEVLALMKAQGESNKFMVEQVFVCGPDSVDPRCTEGSASSAPAPGLQAKEHP